MSERNIDNRGSHAGPLGRHGLTRRVALAGFGILLIVALTVVALLVALSRLDDASHDVHEVDTARASVENVERVALDLQAGARGYAITGDPSFLTAADDARREWRPTLQRVDAVMDGPDDRLLVEQLARDMAALDTAYQQLVELARTDRAAAQARIAERRGEPVLAVRATLDRILARLDARRASREDVRDQASAVALVVALLGSGATAAFVAWGTLTLRRRVARPLEEVADAATRLAAGDGTARASMGGIDEIGLVQRSFNDMADSLVQRERDLEAVRDRAVRQAAIDEALLETTPDGLTFFDEQTHIHFSNSAVERYISSMLGAPAGVGAERPNVKDLADAIAPRTTDPERYRREFAELVARPDEWHRHEFTIAATGQVFLRLGNPVLTPDGERIGTLVLLREITAERAAERAKDDLMAAVSHELRTPLASVLGFAELLETRELSRDAQQRYAATIHQEARRLTALVDDLIDLRLLEAGRLALTPESVDVTALAREQAALFARQTDRHRIEVEAPDEPLVIGVDRLRLGQIVANLLSNAIKYSPAGGRVQLRTERLDGRVRLCVSDEGVGIPAAQQQRLFERFFRADRTAIREIGGSGIGLALTRELVHLLGGEIGFTSREGEGSTFWVDLAAPTR